MTRTGSGRLGGYPRARLASLPTPIEAMPNLSRRLGRPALFVKRDDLTGLGLGGNKVRQVEFWLGDAREKDADTVLVTGAVQSNYVRTDTVEALTLAARCEGLVLDPVYTAKTLAGLIAEVRRGRWSAAQRVLFVHTGGSPALFAYEPAVSAAVDASRGR